MPALVARPRAFGESTIRRDVPAPLVEAIGRCDKAGGRRALRAISRAAESSGFDAACRAAEGIFGSGRVPDGASCDLLARRIAGGAQEEGGADLAVYDLVARGGEVRCRLATRWPRPWWRPASGARSPSRCSPSGPAAARPGRWNSCSPTSRRRRRAATRRSGRRFCAGARCPRLRPSTATTGRRCHGPDGFGRDDLLSLSFMCGREDLVLMGDVGTGKTHMASALCVMCCEEKVEARFFTASSLVMRLRRANDDGRPGRELAQIGRAELLVIDELGFLPLDAEGARLLFQVVSQAYETQSVVFTTNLEFSRWGSVFGDDQMAAAVIDRVVHHGRLLRFRGESYRVRHALMQGGAQKG